LKRARATGCIFEINANPNRLDLSDENARLAKEHGVKIVVNTDAHSIAELNFMPAGINQARRSWLEAKDVLNTLSLSKLLKMLKRKR
jgi:DNA polymerase (family 10)